MYLVWKSHRSLVKDDISKLKKNRACLNQWLILNAAFLIPPCICFVCGNSKTQLAWLRKINKSPDVCIKLALSFDGQKLLIQLNAWNQSPKKEKFSLSGKKEKIYGRTFCIFNANSPASRFLVAYINPTIIHTN